MSNLEEEYFGPADSRHYPDKNLPLETKSSDPKVLAELMKLERATTARMHTLGIGQLPRREHEARQLGLREIDA